MTNHDLSDWLRATRPPIGASESTQTLWLCSLRERMLTGRIDDSRAVVAGLIDCGMTPVVQSLMRLLQSDLEQFIDSGRGDLATLLAAARQPALELLHSNFALRQQWYNTYNEIVSSGNRSDMRTLHATSLMNHHRELWPCCVEPRQTAIRCFTCGVVAYCSEQCERQHSACHAGYCLALAAVGNSLRAYKTLASIELLCRPPMPLAGRLVAAALYLWRRPAVASSTFATLMLNDLNAACLSPIQRARLEPVIARFLGRRCSVAQLVQCDDAARATAVLIAGSIESTDASQVASSAAAAHGRAQRPGVQMRRALVSTLLTQQSTTTAFILTLS